MKFETTLEMEIALSNFFGIRQNLIVPNVSWGLFHYEIDLLMISKSGYATEIEIKVSRSDLKKDKEKRHGHRNEKIKRLYFAIPKKIGIDFALKNIPERAGLIVVDNDGRCKIEKQCKQNTNAKQFSNEERYQAARLGSLRIWGLKRAILKYKSKIN